MSLFPPRRAEEPTAEDRERAANSQVGWLITIALIAVQGALGLYFSGRAERQAAAAAAAHRAEIWWVDTPHIWLGVVAVTALLLLCALPSGFGAKGRLSFMPYLGARRWWLLGAAVACVLAANVVTAQADSAGGYANPDGAVWTVNGREVARRPWSQAWLELSCEMHGRRNRDPVLRFDARFPHGLTAPLAWNVGTTYPRTASRTDWLEAVRPINAAIPAHLHHRGVMDDRCVSNFLNTMDGGGQRMFRELMRLD